MEIHSIPIVLRNRLDYTIVSYRLNPHVNICSTFTIWKLLCKNGKLQRKKEETFSHQMWSTSKKKKNELPLTFRMPRPLRAMPIGLVSFLIWAVSHSVRNWHLFALSVSFGLLLCSLNQRILWHIIIRHLNTCRFHWERFI